VLPKSQADIIIGCDQKGNHGLDHQSTCSHRYSVDLLLALTGLSAHRSSEKVTHNFPLALSSAVIKKGNHGMGHQSSHRNYVDLLLALTDLSAHPRPENVTHDFALTLS